MEKRKIKFKGICKDAETLGVTRMHLFKVLNGNRESQPLLKRYEALKKQQAAEAIK